MAQCKNKEKSIMDEMISKDYFHWLINFLLFEFHLMLIQLLLVVLVDEYVEYIDLFLSLVQEDDLKMNKIKIKILAGITL